MDTTILFNDSNGCPYVFIQVPYGARFTSTIISSFLKQMQQKTQDVSENVIDVFYKNNTSTTLSTNLSNVLKEIDFTLLPITNTMNPDFICKCDKHSVVVFYRNKEFKTHTELLDYTHTMYIEEGSYDNSSFISGDIDTESIV